MGRAVLGTGIEDYGEDEWCFLELKLLCMYIERLDVASGCLPIVFTILRSTRLWMQRFPALPSSRPCTCGARQLQLRGAYR